MAKLSSLKKRQTARQIVLLEMSKLRPGSVVGTREIAVKHGISREAVYQAVHRLEIKKVDGVIDGVRDTWLIHPHDEKAI